MAGHGMMKRISSRSVSEQGDREAKRPKLEKREPDGRPEQLFTDEAEVRILGGCRNTIWLTC